jgi:type IV secretory pathway TraG/TraD family ATPase VirD4
MNQEKREYISNLIKKYKAETGNEAVSKGSVTERFQKWREKLKEKELLQSEQIMK